MRKLPLGVAVSTAVHAAAVAWIGTRAVALPRAPAVEALTPIEIVAVAPPPPPATTPPPLDVVLLDDPPPAASQAPSSRQPAAPRESVAAVTAPGTRAPAETLGPQSPTNPGTGPTTNPKPSPAPSPWMAMRRGELPRLALPAGRWDPLDHAPDGTAPELPRATGILHESGRGSYESDQGGFLGKVNPDGTVRLHDKPSANIHLALPTLKTLGYAIADWYEAEKGPFGETTVMPGQKQIQLSMGTTTDPGDQAHPEHMLKDHAKTVIIPVFAGGVEITDWLMRRKGIDPYASRKLKLLDATRDERVQMGNRHRAQQLALTPQIVQRNLERLWAALPDTAARKQALFELWDECVETGDPAVVAGGEAARRLVIAFIRAHMPPGGPDAFSPAELAELARIRHSKAEFAPYD